MGISKRHFHTFDALRFLAFFKVFLLHLPVTAFPVFNYLKKGGGIGVLFFFVLSGFLITYIILDEKKATGKLDLYHFYMRRILRIWPLYYAMIAFAYFTPVILSIIGLKATNIGYQPNWLLSLTFLENYKTIITGTHANVSPLPVMWSLCIEEHFYIVWGIILYFTKPKRVPHVLFFSILLSLVANTIFIHKGIETAELLTNLIYFALGAIPAYLLVYRKEQFDRITSGIPMPAKWISVILLLGYVILSPNIQYSFKLYLEPLIFGILFCSLLFFTIPERNSLKIADSNILSRLGIYTYGLYLYHTIVINFLSKVFDIRGISLAAPLNSIIFSTLALTLTAGVSYLSYIWFERFFLRLKKYFY